MPPNPKSWTNDDMVKSLQRHYALRYAKTGHEHFMLVMDPNDISRWYILFLNMGHPYEGGEFLVKLDAPNGYPYKAPKFTFLTPNNRFKTTGRPCISTGEYHEGNWSPATGMCGFTLQIFYALKAPMEVIGGGIGIYTKEEQSDAKKKNCADKSVKYNQKNYPEIMKLFEEERLKYQERFGEKSSEEESLSESDSSLSSLSMPSEEEYEEPAPKPKLKTSRASKTPKKPKETKKGSKVKKEKKMI